RAIQPATEVFTKGVKAYPHSERMLVGLGTALHASGLYAQAAEKLCAASDLKPSDATPYLFLGKMVGASSQPLPCAEEKLSRFVSEQPTSGVANYYYTLALSKRESNSAEDETIKKIESLLDRSIQLDPHFADAYLQLGIVRASRGDLSRSIVSYKKAIAANPDLAEAHFRLAQAYKKIGNSANAQREFQAYEQIQKKEAATIEQQRREVQQFVIVFKDQPQGSATPNP